MAIQNTSKRRSRKNTKFIQFAIFFAIILFCLFYYNLNKKVKNRFKEIHQNKEKENNVINESNFEEELNEGMEMDDIAFPDYDVSDIRSEWKFSISKNYQKSQLFAYQPVGPIIPKNYSAPGENGTIVDIPPEMQELRDKLFDQYHISIIESDMVSYHREMPDVRNEACKQRIYPKRLPKASVIIIFHNEIWSVLLRTIWSVIIHSPKELLEEIILVDDVSTFEELKKPLIDYVDTLSVPIKLIRTQKREGLIRARLIGAKQAKGNVLLFIDAHMECIDGFLEPLLTRIASDRSVIAVPLIDSVTADYMKLDANLENINGFRYSLLFDWRDIPERELKRVKHDRTAPIRTPTLVGCAFAVDRDFFYEIGSFDEQMNIWGGENIEMSFRVWQCGGMMEMIPCSRIAHMYRISTYSFEGDKSEIKYHNLVRAVEVWMDEYKKYYYFAEPLATKAVTGDLTERIELRKRLKCNSYKWFLDHIFPEHPFFESNFMGEIINNGRCIDHYGEGPAKVYGCHGQGGNQAYIQNSFNQIFYTGGDCLCREGNTTSLTFCKPSKDDYNQRWIIDRENKLLINEGSELCVACGLDDYLYLKSCNSSDEKMKWEFKQAEKELKIRTTTSTASGASTLK